MKEIPTMTLPTWLTLLRATRERNLAIERGKRRKAVPRRLNLERLEDRTLLSTFWVTNTGDNGGVNPVPGAGTGTLRQAILDADAAATGTAANPDQIQFNIPSTDAGYNSMTGAFTIQPLSALPTITDTLVLDGYTQPGASPNTLTIGDNAVLNIVLDGSKAGAVDGLTIAAGNCTVRGLVIDNYSAGSGFAAGFGLALCGGNDVVTGNFIGTDVTGEAAAPNNNGLLTTSPGDIIGGPSPAGRNIISGNTSTQPGYFGIYLASGGNVVQGNYIGTDKSGTVALGNYIGIEDAGELNNTIGGLTGTPGTAAGNVISGNANDGLVILGTQALVAGNLIGTTATGLAALGNGVSGIGISGNNNTIGGTTSGARNIVSGNGKSGGGAGISIAFSQNNLVEGNYIGTDITGTTALYDGQVGIIIEGANNTIGGTTAAARNIISGNSVAGMQLVWTQSPVNPTFGNVVQGNYIGTDPSGKLAVPNSGSGIWMEGGIVNNSLGGTLNGAGNVISGNIQDGILLFADVSDKTGSPTNNLIQGNFIGTDETGTVALGNDWSGIAIFGANNTTVGGSTPGAGNTIAFNAFVAGDGVQVDSGTGNSILSNSIFANGIAYSSLFPNGAGIFLNTANNANNNQAAPVLTGVSSSGSGTTFTGTLQSVANTTFRIEFFASAGMDPSGDGQGQTYLGFATVTTDASGIASFTATVTTVVPRGYFISATATNQSTGDTSQFSKDLVVISFLVTNTNDSGTGSLREAIYDANTLAYGTAVSPDPIAFDITTTDPGYNSTTGAFTIQPLSALPTITDTLVLDGYTEPGASPNTLTIGDNAVLDIVLDGSKAGAVDGLVVAGGNSTVCGLVIDNFAYGSAIVLKLQGNDVVVGNYIGTDVTGDSAAANNVGIVTNPNELILSTGNRIGGAVPADRNIISGNNSGQPSSADGGSNPADLGIDIDNGNLIQGNYIGTDKSGTNAVPNGKGLVLGSNNTIGGLTAIPGTGAGNVISGNTGTGLFLGGNQNVTAGNLIGTTATGVADLGNGDGIHLWGNNNTIGGITPEARNIVAGNSLGINIEAVALGGGSYNIVEGNYIGTDITGTTSLGPQRGIAIFGGHNTIGGPTAAARNTISGNGGGDGIQISAPYGGVSLDNVIQGNYLGTDASGTTTLANFLDIDLRGVTYDNIIGGALPGDGNLIAGGGNAGGILLTDVEGDLTLHPTDNLIQGNLLGTDKTGTIAIGGNRRFNDSGITIENGDNNTIGGTVPGAGNTIAFNSDEDAVDVERGTGNSILGNSIFANRAGIILTSANNANNNQAAPVLTSAGSASSGTTISGTLASVANTTFRVEFFANQQPNPSGYGEGQTFLGAITVTTDGGGNASFTASLSNPVPLGERYLSATATVANSDSTFGDTSQFAKDLFLPFNFIGFLPPLNQNMAFALNRNIPIKFQLTDVNGAIITSLSAVTSLQIAPVNPDNSLGTPFNPTPTPGTSLRNDGSQYIFNWQTKGLAAGTYEILLTLSDGTLHTKVIELSRSGSSVGLTTVAAGGTGTAPGGLLGGDIDVYVDNSNGDLTADELARVQDAVTAVDAVTEPYGVAVTEVTDPTLADVTLNMDTTSAVGGYADGVLGCTTDAGQITLINGWNFYAGSDATQIGSGQYDFETVVTHELGHALGLGHSTDSTSVMYATLNTGTVNRSLTTADLNVPDTGTTGACGLHAAVVDVGRVSDPSYANAGRVGDPSYGDGRDMAFAMLTADPSRNASMGPSLLAAGDIVFANGLASGSAGHPVALAANFGPTDSSPIFAARLQRAEEDSWLEAPLFPDRSQDGLDDAATSDGTSAHQAEQVANFPAADPRLLDY
jgi:hypothetical protein